MNILKGLSVFAIIAIVINPARAASLPSTMFGRWCQIDAVHIEGGRFEGDSRLFRRVNQPRDDYNGVPASYRPCDKQKVFVIDKSRAGRCSFDMVVSSEKSYLLRCRDVGYDYGQIIRFLDERSIWLNVEDMAWRSRPDEFDQSE